MDLALGIVIGIFIGAANPGSAAWIKAKFAAFKAWITKKKSD